MMSRTWSASAERISTSHTGAEQAAADLQELRNARAPLDKRLSRVGFAHSTVQVTPVDSVKRLGIGRAGWFAETIHAPFGKTIELQFKGPIHLLIMYSEGARRNGETSINGLLPSKIRSFASKLTFVPAGCDYREQFETAACTRLTFLYLDPVALETGGESDCAPRVHFEDSIVWETAAKLKSAIENGQAKSTPYLSALSSVLALELSRCDHDAACDTPLSRGGLASWQERIVMRYVEEHMYEQISLVTLAKLVRLSQHHFCRAFKRSFGVPPHQYHLERRIEQAKMLLADCAISITDIGMTLGYSQMSSFSVAFRKMTGWAPSEYRRKFKQNESLIAKPIITCLIESGLVCRHVGSKRSRSNYSLADRGAVTGD
jgi:AraC family transcriptional regulator